MFILKYTDSVRRNSTKRSQVDRQYLSLKKKDLKKILTRVNIGLGKYDELHFNYEIISALSCRCLIRLQVS